MTISIGLLACDSNSDNGSSITDSSAPDVEMIDSARNTAPPEGTGDTNRDSNAANDSVKRIGDSSTSRGDSSK